MEFGYFAMPSHPPERGLKAGHDWDLQTLRWLDELGYAEAWIGEHYTAPWEPHPSPDLLIAQALLQTKRIRIGPGGFLLPYHHPAELAARVAMLDHLSEGRLNFGVAASGLPTDWAMFQVDGTAGVNREMTREALDIILRLWGDEPHFVHQGKFWTVEKPEPMFGFLKPHIYPQQRPHPPIGVAGFSKNSDTLKLAGERGFLPLSLNLKHDPNVADSDVTPEYCARHNWLVGSPATVAEKLERIYHEAGGFGGLLVFGFDYVEQPEAWHNSLRLLMQEVAPRVAHLTPGRKAAAE